jgi:hypothetical protein
MYLARTLTEVSYGDVCRAAEINWLQFTWHRQHHVSVYEYFCQFQSNGGLKYDKRTTNYRRQTYVPVYINIWHNVDCPYIRFT